jgi:hypothetical protein
VPLLDPMDLVMVVVVVVDAPVRRRRRTDVGDGPPRPLHPLLMERANMVGADFNSGLKIKYHLF